MDAKAVDKLSEMQIACLRLVADLKKTEQIAAELGIAPSTVNTHIERAIARLQVPNRRAAARLVVDRDVDRGTPGQPAGDALDPIACSNCREKFLTEQSPLSDPTAETSHERSSPVVSGERRNDLTICQRLLLGLLLLVLLCLGIGGLGAAIEQLSRWRASYATPR